MKKILIVLFPVLMSIPLYAQNGEIQTIFGGDTRISGMGGPTMSFSSIDGEFALMMGGGGGVLLGDFFLGGYGEGLTNPIMSGGNKTEFSHGGIWTGYSYYGNKPYHPAISIQMGWGTLTQRDESTVLSTDNLLVINPVIELEMNLFRFFRLGIGANYRIVSGINTSPFTNQDFSGPGASLTFKFGWF